MKHNELTLRNEYGPGKFAQRELGNVGAVEACGFKSLCSVWEYGGQAPWSARGLPMVRVQT